MQNSVTNEEIIKCEEKYWQALKEDDVNTAVELTHFPCTILSPQGARSVTEENYRRIMQDNDGSKFKDIQVEQPVVNIIKDDVAVITYQIHFNDQKMLDATTWVKRDGSWKCALHSENPLG